MTSTEATALPVRRFPSRIASLGFSMRLPADWISHDLPEEAPDFADPTRLVPLAAVTAPHAAIVWAVAARPAYGDGTLGDWAGYLLAQHGLQAARFAEGRLGNLPALLGECEQPSELGPLRVRFAFAEDGGRLINLSLTAPGLLADAVSPLWMAAVQSFQLDDAAGSTVALVTAAATDDDDDALVGDGMAGDMRAGNSTADDHHADGAAPGDPMAETLPLRMPAPLAAGHGPQAPHDDDGQLASSLRDELGTLDLDIGAEAQPAVAAADEVRTQAISLPPGDTLGDHARADDTASLNPEHPMNRHLREGGVGQVPRLVAVDQARRCVSVACGAITAQVDLPFGWHAVDDGRRVLVFDPEGNVEIQLDLLPCGARALDALLDELQATVQREGLAAGGTAPECLRFRNGAMHALSVRGLRDGDQGIERFDLLVPGPDARRALHARITATPAQATAAANLGELLLASAVFGSFAVPAPAAETGPDWWMAAQLLERANRLEQAEQMITASVDHIGAALQVAELYRQRMLRLLRENDQPGADQARAQAVRWVQHYAASATSGGEGAALSRERDAFIASLSSRA